MSLTSQLPQWGHLLCVNKNLNLQHNSFICYYKNKKNQHIPWTTIFTGSLVNYSYVLQLLWYREVK
jgi:hypothetical protein